MLPGSDESGGGGTFGFGGGGFGGGGFFDAPATGAADGSGGGREDLAGMSVLARPAAADRRRDRWWHKAPSMLHRFVEGRST